MDKMKKLTLILIIVLGTFLYRCKPTEPTLGSLPSKPSFTYEAVDANNIAPSEFSGTGGSMALAGFPCIQIGNGCPAQIVHPRYIKDRTGGRPERRQ